MSDDEPAQPKKVIAMAPRLGDMERRIHELAKNTSNIVWSEHFDQRAEERDFTTVDALKVLRGGHLEGPILPGRKPGEWKGKMTKRLKGHREAGVVVVVIRNDRIFVKTIEWEDWRGQ